MMHDWLIKHRGELEEAAMKRRFSEAIQPLVNQYLAGEITADEVRAALEPICSELAQREITPDDYPADALADLMMDDPLVSEPEYQVIIEIDKDRYQ